eukprot:TRINITY_DN24693_c0_g1_i3.p1 TRINITY_DN24693_c0_g1~~TRINITY_DN24693_c0_g1_i3.p1  ORF type:complete len:812 (-),score=126.28 TRINITY_DN24693_c0_g1_i3:16-2451(-)
MCSLLRHPSIVLAHLVLCTLNRLIGELSSKGADLLRPHLQNVLVLARDRSRKYVFERAPPSSHPARFYALVDFADDAECRDHFGLLRTQAKTTLGLITDLEPEISMQFVVWCTEQLLSAHAEPSPTELRNAAGHADLRSQMAAEWELQSWVIAAVLEGLDFKPPPVHEKIFNGPMKHVLTGLVERLLAYQPKEPTVIPLYLNLVVSMHPMLKCWSGSTTYLQTLMSKLFDFMVFKTPADGTDRLHPDTVGARKRAHNCFIRLAVKMPNQLLPYLPDIYKYTTALIQSNSMLDSEVSFLFEAMASISNSMDAQQRAQFFNMILEPAASVWVQDSEVYRVCAEGPLFVQALLGENPTARRQISQCLNVFCGMFRRATSSAGEAGVVQALHCTLPTTLALVRSIHALWDPAGLTHAIPESHRGILLLTPEEELALAGGRAISTGLSSLPEASVLRLADFLKNTRWNCYQLLGIVPQFSPVLYEQYGSLVQQYVFSSTASISNHHLRLLLSNFVHPFITFCPSEHFGVLARFIPALCRLLYSRLNEQWLFHTGQYESQDAEVDNDSPVDDSTKREYLDLRILSELTIYSLDLFFHIMSCGPTPAPLPPSSDPTRHIKEHQRRLAPLFFSDFNVLNAICMLLSGCILWPERRAAVNTFRCLGKMLPVLAARPEFDPALHMLMGCALQRLLRSAPSTASSSAQEAAALQTSGEDQLVFDITAFIGLLYAQRCNSPPFRSLWQQAGVPEAALVDLDAQLNSGGDQRKLMKAFIQPLLPAASGDQRRVILNLPQWSFDRRRTENDPLHEEVIGISSLFA